MTVLETLPHWYDVAVLLSSVITRANTAYLCFFFRAILCISAAYAVAKCTSVCLSVTFVYSVETSKHVFKLFSPPSNHRILVLRYGNISTGPPNGGVECRWGRHKSRFSTSISRHRVLSTLRPPSVIHAAAHVGDAHSRIYDKRPIPVTCPLG